MADNMIFFNDNSLQRGRRRHVRFEIRKPIEFIEMEPEETGIFRGETRNMSEGGLMFTTTAFVPVGSYIIFRVEQTSPQRIIAKGLSQVLRVSKNALNQDIYEIACQTAEKFRSLRTDEWDDMKEAAGKVLARIRPPREVAAAAKQQAAPRRKVLEQMSLCPCCGSTVMGEERLCPDCEGRIRENFVPDRGYVYGTAAALAATPAPSARRPVAAARSAVAAPEEDRQVKTAARITQTLNRVTDHAIRIIDRLGTKGDLSAMPYLEKALKSNSPEIVSAAREAMELIQEKQKHKTYS